MMGIVFEGGKWADAPPTKALGRLGASARWVGLGEACGRDGARCAICFDLELFVPLESIRGTDGSEIACSTYRYCDDTTNREL